MIIDNINVVLLSGLLFLLSFILLIPLFLLNNDTYNKYTYIDINGNLGHSNICKQNYCDLNGKKIYVKDFLDNRK